ncbi:MAG TPA: sigma-70 family RNA polymerase sigma factor [Xanthobacteraceae bacterium]|jgi:RNA polymerase sigma-70 factor (ECF subfamily)
MLTLATSSQITIPVADKTAATRDVSDEALVDAIAAGDRGAMRTLYLRHNVRIYRFVLRLTGDAASAEDIVSEVFLDVWRQAAAFEARSRAATWILSIARYKALSALRGRAHDRLDDDAAMAVADPADDPETVLHHQDRSAIVRKCLSQLSAIHREVLDLVYYHDKSVDEVAEIVGVPPSTVKTRMFYARRRMEGLLESEGVALN